MKEKLFNKLKELGMIPEGMTLENSTEEFLLELTSKITPATSDEQAKRQLTNEEFQEMVQKNIEQALKDKGLDKTDAKYLRIPGWEDCLTEQEKKLVEHPENLTAPQKRALANKMLKHFAAPIVDGKVSKRSLALNAESSNAVGLYTVPTEFIAEVSRLMVNYGVMRRNAYIFNMNSKTAQKPKLLTKPTGGYVSEANAAGESNPTFDQISFTRHDYAFITGVTKQLLQDTGVDLIGLLAELAANDFAKAEDAQCFNGSTLTGYLAGNSDIVQVTTSGAGVDTIVHKKLIDMIFGTPYGQAIGSKFFWHRSVLAQLLKSEDTSGRPIFTLADQLSILATKRILGYEYELVEVMQPVSGVDYLGATNDPVAGDIVAYYGDMRKAATLAIRQDMEIEISDVATVGSNSAFEKRLVFWRFEHSHDFNVEQGAALTKLVLGGS
jgi:HK97 family phage major capsid protein